MDTILPVNTDPAAEEKAKNSFENVIGECALISNPDHYFRERGKCKCCDAVYNSRKHVKSVNHHRRVVCIEIFKAHKKVKEHTEPDETLNVLKTLREKLQTPATWKGSQVYLLCLDRRIWPNTASGAHNENRGGLDGAKIWFIDFIVEVNRTCEEIVNDLTLQTIREI